MPSTAPPLLALTDLSLTEQGHEVLASLSLAVQAGEQLAVVGESGAGKSTLLQLVAGLVQPSTGEVRVAGQRVMRPADALVPGHPGVAYLAQKPDLPKFLRVEQVLRYASQLPTAQAAALPALCRIEHLLPRQTHELSGGEAQRVALARRLLAAPRLLLLDEPFSNLDRAHVRELQAVLEDAGRRLGTTIILVSHDARDTLGWATRLLVLRRGQVVQQGNPQHLYQHPTDAYVAGLLGDYSELPPLAAARLFPGGAAGPRLVRPEQLQLVAGRRAPRLAGTVRAVRYQGAFYEVEVALATGLVRLRVAAPPVVGTSVWVAATGK